jgi:hypothetical protein
MAQSMGLSVTEKASSTKIVLRLVVGIKICEGKVPSTSGHASTRVVDLYASSASDEETVPPEPCQKCLRSSPPPKSILKLSDASAVEGTTSCGAYFLFI